VAEVVEATEVGHKRKRGTKVVTRVWGPLRGVFSLESGLKCVVTIVSCSCCTWMNGITLSPLAWK